MICHEPLVKEVSESFICGHSYHVACIDRYVEVTGRPRVMACAIGCHRSAVVSSRLAELDDRGQEMEDEAVAAAAAAATLPVDDDNAVDLEGEAAAGAIP